MTRQSVLFLCCLVAVATASLYGKNSAVIQLTKENFASMVHDNNEMWVVEFYAPWCGHCKNFAPEYEKFAQNVHGVIKVGAVNVEVEQELGSYYKVQGIPTIKYFLPTKTVTEQGRKIKAPQSYDGARSTASLQVAMLLALPDYVVKVYSKNLDSFINTDPDMGKALLFTSQTRTTALYKTISMEFKDRLTIGEISIAPANDPKKQGHDVAEKYGIEAYPTLLVFPPRTDDKPVEPIKYEGEIDGEQIIAFLTPYAKPSPFAKKTSSDSKGKTNSKTTTKPAEEVPKIPPQTKLVQIKDQATLKSECLDRNGICALAFFLPEDPEDTATRAGYYSQLEKLFEKYGNGQSAFNFGWLELGFGDNYASVRKFANTFGVLPDNLPRLVLLNPNKKRAAEFFGAFDFESLSEFMNKVLSGTKSTYALDKVPDLA